MSISRIGSDVDRFWVFYQLQNNLGFFFFAMCGVAKKLLINPPKSYHDWKSKIFLGDPHRRGLSCTWPYTKGDTRHAQSLKTWAGIKT
ncbi:hypothetical protein Hanom_Chr16g01513691 [Helianthus anomalus]